MEIIIFLTWLLLFLMLPVAIFVSVTIAFAAGIEKVSLVGRILLAIAGYFATTVLTLAFLLSLLFGIGEPRRSLEFSAGEQLIGLTIVFSYAVAGWLLCSLVNGKLIKSWTHFSLDSGGKLTSIFNRK